MSWLSNLFSKAKKAVVSTINKVKAAVQVITQNISNSIKKVEAANNAAKQKQKSIISGVVDKAKKAVQNYADSWKETIKKGVENAGKKVDIATLTSGKGISGLELIAAVTPIGGIEAGAAKGIISKAGTEAILKKTGYKALMAAAKKLVANPIFKLFQVGALSVFMITEIPNYFQMRIFARNQIAESAGLSPDQVTFPLNEQDSHFKNLIYDLSTATKASNWKKANEILDDMKATRDTFQNILTAKASVLAQINMAETEQDNLEYMNSIISRAEDEIAPEIEKTRLEIPDTIKGKVREITDGDTIRVEWKNPSIDYVNVSAVRLVGINSPESSEKGYKESKAWLNSQIWGKEIVLETDANNRMDVYDRILAVVFLNGEDINLKSVKNGWAMTYFLEPHRSVNQTDYQKAEDYARNESLGVWALNKEYGSVGVGSKPTHAKIYLDGTYTKLQTSETLKNVEPGEHTIKLSLSGYKTYSEAITVEANKKEEIYAILEKEISPEPTPGPEPEPEPEPGPSNWPDYPDVAVADSAIPSTFTDSQSWALGEAFTQIEILIKGQAVMSEAERKTLMDSFLLYTDEQKLVLNLLWQDVAFFEKGSRQMSAEEFNTLKSKYRIEAIE